METYRNFVDNDIYFMEIVSDKIIINDNYKGIIILDNQFNVIKKVGLFDELFIYTCFIKSKEIVLYCNENNCLVYLDMNSYEYKIISLGEDLQSMTFFYLYEWVNNDLFLAVDNGLSLIHVNLLTDAIQVIQRNTTDILYNSIFNNWNKLQDYTIHKVYYNNAIVEMDNKIFLFDYKNDIKSLLEIEYINFHDIEVKTGYILQISEKRVMVSCDNKNIFLYPEYKYYSYLRGKVITEKNKDYLILLSVNNSDLTQARIEKYDIESL